MSAINKDIQLVTFYLGGGEYGIDVMRVREITGMTEITGAVNTPHHVRGMVNVRGAIVPVISLRRRLGLPDSPDERESCIAVMDLKGALTGFIIDEISDVIRISRDDLQPSPDGAAQPWVEGILVLDRKLVAFLNLETLV